MKNEKIEEAGHILNLLTKTASLRKEWGDPLKT